MRTKFYFLTRIWVITAASGEQLVTKLPRDGSDGIYLSVLWWAAHICRDCPAACEECPIINSVPESLFWRIQSRLWLGILQGEFKGEYWTAVGTTRILNLIMDPAQRQLWSAFEVLFCLKCWCYLIFIICSDCLKSAASIFCQGQSIPPYNSPGHIVCVLGCLSAAFDDQFIVQPKQWNG